MPEPSWYTYKLTDATHGVRAYEHEISVVMPWRRYLPHGMPPLALGSPSEIAVGEETRHGTELAVRRLSYDAAPSEEMQSELLGELAEAWVFMTMDMSSRIDPRFE